MNVRRVRRTAVVALLAGVVLAGCANQAGDASVVGDSRVTDRQVADYTSELEAQVAGIKGATYDEAKATSTAVEFLTRDLILNEIAARNKLTVTQGDIDAFAQSYVAQNYNGDRQAFIDAEAGSNNVPKSMIDAEIRGAIIYTAIGRKVAATATTQDEASTLVAKYLAPIEAELGVEVAPRYGTWKALTLGPVPNDLSALPPVAPGTGSGIPQPLPLPQGP